MRKQERLFTVLFVEDDPLIRELLTQLLIEEGVRVIALPDPTNQIDVMLKEKDNLDLVITGIILPHIDGLTILKIAKQKPELKHIPWVFCSNCANQIIINEAILRGANAFYPKHEYTPDQLVRKIMNILHHPAN